MYVSNETDNALVAMLRERLDSTDFLLCLCRYACVASKRRAAYSFRMNSNCFKMRGPMHKNS